MAFETEVIVDINVDGGKFLQLHEGCGGRFVAPFRDTGFEDLALVIDRTPEVNHFAVELDEHFIKLAALWICQALAIVASAGLAR